MSSAAHYAVSTSQRHEQFAPPPFGYQLDKVVHSLAEMPVLEALVRKYAEEQPLRDVSVLLIQHQLGNQGPQIEALMELGLQPRNVYWLDIPYTSSSRFRTTIADRLQIRDERFWTNRYRVLEPYDLYQLRRAQEMVRHLLRLRPKRLVVLDDGAYFLAATSGFRRQFPNVAVVEQTTRGLIKLQENAALRDYARRVPIIDVASSKPKRVLESPWIGFAVLAALEEHISKLGRVKPKFQIHADSPCLVLGYGTIGRKVAGALRNKVTVYVCDPNKETEAEQQGFATWKRGTFNPRFKLVVGCSGRQSFGVGDFIYLDDHAVLASASSGSVELSRRDFIELAAASQIDDIAISTRTLQEDDIHQHLHIKLVNRKVVFLNAGFPINFDGRLNCVPVKYMQATAWLMVYGAIVGSQKAATAVTPAADGPLFIDLGDKEFSSDIDELDTAFRAQLSHAELACLDVGSSA